MLLKLLTRESTLLRVRSRVLTNGGSLWLICKKLSPLGPSKVFTAVLKWVKPTPALSTWASAACPARPSKAGEMEALRPNRGNSLLAVESIGGFEGKLKCIFVDIFNEFYSFIFTL
jgi:hypothetical protein